MNGWVVGGLGFRRTDTAHAPQLVSGVYHTCCPPTPRLRAPQAVIEKSRILRSLCKGRNSFAMEKSRALRRSAAHLGRRETGIAHPALSLRGAEQLRDGEKSRAPRLGCASVCLVGKRLEIAHPALSLRGSGKESVRSAA